MNIAFLSSSDPTSIRSWSGTLYYICQSLKKDHRVTWLGRREYAEVVRFHQANGQPDADFCAEQYAPLFGKMLSDALKEDFYDVVVCRDYFFLAYLVTDLPVLYIGDTNFRLFNPYMGITDPEFIRVAEDLEQRSVDKATHLVFSSGWVRESAMRDYQAAPDKISVIEFGANLDRVPACPGEQEDETCHLLFIGTNWEMKGGPKVLETYRELQQAGVDCTLSIVGSVPPQAIDDPHIRVYPFIDKSTEEGQALFEQLFAKARFLVAPTRFECFGIVYCEAAAYGIPVLTSDVGGVSQVVREGENGFLFPVDAPASDYAARIRQLLEDPTTYRQLREQSRTHFEQRLNWDTWREKMNALLVRLTEEEGNYIPVYAINMKEREDRRNHILREFEGKPEFELHLTEACTHAKGTIGLWNSIVKIIRKAKEEEEEVIILCEDDHYFTEHYSPKLLFKQIEEAYMQGADLLSGGIGGFGQAVKVGPCRYWVDWLWCTQFVVVYSSFYDRILEYEFKDDDTADGVFSQLTSHKMVIYPFISEQCDFGYSDVTPSNMNQQGMIRRHFARANAQFGMIERVREWYGIVRP